MGRDIRNLSGQRFGRLVVLERDITKPIGTGKPVYWLCKCDCGNIKSVRMDKLLKNDVRSCGCLSQEARTARFLHDLAGKRFGKLEVIKRDTSAPKGTAKPAYWICKCDCGSMVSIRADHLVNNTTRSCGCINSKGEFLIKQILQEHNINFKAQYHFNDLRGKNNSYLLFDFAIFDRQNNLYCLIEFQGDQHYKPFNFDTEERFNLRQQYDWTKREYCTANGINLIEIKYSELNNLSFEYLKSINAIPTDQLDENWLWETWLID